jgi:hypothetical protein
MLKDRHVPVAGLALYFELGKDWRAQSEGVRMAVGTSRRFMRPEE